MSSFPTASDADPDTQQGVRSRDSQLASGHACLGSVHRQPWTVSASTIALDHCCLSLWSLGHPWKTSFFRPVHSHQGLAEKDKRVLANTQSTALRGFGAGGFVSQGLREHRAFPGLGSLGHQK